MCLTTPTAFTNTNFNASKYTCANFTYAMNDNHNNLFRTRSGPYWFLVHRWPLPRSNLEGGKPVAVSASLLYKSGMSELYLQYSKAGQKMNISDWVWHLCETELTSAQLLQHVWPHEDEVLHWSYKTICWNGIKRLLTVGRELLPPYAPNIPGNLSFERCSKPGM